MFIVFIIFGVFYLNKISSNQEYIFKREYESLNNKYINVQINKKNNVKYLNKLDISKIFNSGTKVIYIGSAKSNNCRERISTFIDTANKYIIDGIYYYDYKYLNNDNDYVKKILIEKNINTNTDYPIIIFISEGEITDIIIDNQDINNSIDNYKTSLKKLISVCSNGC